MQAPLPLETPSLSGAQTPTVIDVVGSSTLQSSQPPSGIDGNPASPSTFPDDRPQSGPMTSTGPSPASLGPPPTSSSPAQHGSIGGVDGKAPLCVVWCLVDSEEMDTETKCRLVESALRAHVALRLVEPRKFILVNARGSSTRHTVVYDDKAWPLPHCLIVWLRDVTSYAMAVTRFLDLAGVVIVNPIDAVATAASRVRTMHELGNAGIPVCKSVQMMPPCSLDWITGALQFPVR